MRHARAACVLLVVVAAACGERSSPAPARYALEAVGGTYDDGSGLRGVAVLATLRDAAGAGPATTWTGTLADASGARAQAAYADSASGGSYAALWWPDVPFASTTYTLALGSADESASASIVVAAGGVGAIPAPALSADGATLSWASGAGVASAECRVTNGSAVVRSTVGAATSCAVGDLPDGAYQASALEYSVDLAALAADASQHPTLPGRFDVAEGRIAFLRAGGAPVAVGAAAGGAIDSGIGVRTLATWLSIGNADATPTALTWAVTIAGPGIDPSVPLAFSYPANFPRLLVWSYDVPAAPGPYVLTATSSAGTFTIPFTVGEPAVLEIPTGIVATDGAQGSAHVAWTAVAGARSYLVGVWQGATFVTSQWVASASADFPQGSFTPGQIYDVYVAATDADMAGGARPTQVAVAENTLQPAGFVAR
jgi:hypothetical protein